MKRRFRRICKCGCKEFVKPGNRYINGHNWLGKKRDTVNRENNSLATRGENNPMYGRRGKDHPRYGKTHTEEAINSMAEKLSYINSGSGNPNWRGGLSFGTYCCSWSDREYKESIKERDGYKCQNPDCWRTSNTICIHHIDYDKMNCRPDNLIAVCSSCNSRANFDRQFWQEHYEEIVSIIL